VPSSSNLIYDFSTLTGPDPLEYARFTSTVGTVGYETAAVLLTEFAALVNPSANTVTDYQYAMWNLFNSSTTVNSTQATLESAAKALVTSNNSYATSAYAHLVIYTPTAAFASNQEFLGLNTTVSPEPALWPVLALAILGATLFRAQSRHAAERQPQSEFVRAPARCPSTTTVAPPVKQPIMAAIPLSRGLC